MNLVVAAADALGATSTSVGLFRLETLPSWLYQALPHIIIGAFVFAFGACLGSFVNVLVYRLPAGISVVSPPSRCPRCGVRLGWRENLPVIGWLLLRGRCRACREPISVHYPGVELLVGSLCALLYIVYFAPGVGTPWWSDVGGIWFASNGPWRTLPIFSLHCMLIAALVAMTLIDARLSIVTLEIPIVVSIFALLLWPLQGMLALAGRHVDAIPLPLPDWPWLIAAVGAMVGLVIANVLVRRGALAETEEDFELELDAPLSPLVWTLLLLPVAIGVGAGGIATETGWLIVVGLAVLLVPLAWGIVAARRQASRASAAAVAPVDSVEEDFPEMPGRDYPASWRLVGNELLFLAPALVLAAIGWWVGAWLGGLLETAPPLPLACLGGSLLGYLGGGGVIWAIRLAGTAGFGREAMGLGDVHLLAAVGAVLGWIDPIAGVILATASGISWAMLTGVVFRRWGGMGSAMPFGPHLAVGCLAVIVMRPAIEDFWLALTTTAAFVP